MPASKKSPKAIPHAPLRKRLLHTFYLIQPILQFLVLVFMVGILSRCSPLAPSASKTASESSNQELNIGGAVNAQELAQEELIKANLKELTNDSVVVVKESDFKKESKNALRAEDRANENDVKALLRNHKESNPLRRSKFISIVLSEEQKEKLWSSGQVRLDLSDYARKILDERAHHLFLKELKKNNESLDVGATAYIVLPDAAFQPDYKDLELNLKVSLSVVDEEKAYLLIKKDEENDSDALLEAALHDSKATAIVLE